MNSKDEFFDRLETYYDFCGARPEDFNPVALRNIALNLVQICDAVRNLYDDPIGDEVHRQMIAVIVGECDSLNQWVREGYMLNQAAGLLRYALDIKFGFTSPKLTNPTERFMNCPIPAICDGEVFALEPVHMLRDPGYDIGLADVSAEWVDEIIASDDPDAEFGQLIDHLSGVLKNAEIIRKHLRKFMLQVA